MADLQQISVEESTKPALANLPTKTNKPTTGAPRPATTASGTAFGTGSGPAFGAQYPQEASLPCGICQKDLFVSARHCLEGCNRHIKGDVCWFCHPEQAPADWLASRGRPGRGGGRGGGRGRGGYRGGRGGGQPNVGTYNQGNTTTSSTGPLHQQSGNANANNRTLASANALFTTNYDHHVAMTNLIVPQDFQSGPQRN